MATPVTTQEQCRALYTLINGDATLQGAAALNGTVEARVYFGPYRPARFTHPCIALQAANEGSYGDGEGDLVRLQRDEIRAVIFAEPEADGSPPNARLDAIETRLVQLAHKDEPYPALTIAGKRVFYFGFAGSTPVLWDPQAPEEFYKVVRFATRTGGT